MTEDEARAKTCCGPQILTLILAIKADSRVELADNPGRCLASACMAWRVRHQWLDNAQEQPDWVNYAPYAFEPGEGQERDDGYCGLAGSPP